MRDTFVLASADAPLRRDVRLLGSILGQILVEQEGQDLLDLSAPAVDHRDRDRTPQRG